MLAEPVQRVWAHLDCPAHAFPHAANPHLGHPPSLGIVRLGAADDVRLDVERISVAELVEDVIRDLDRNLMERPNIEKSCLGPFGPAAGGAEATWRCWHLGARFVA